MPLPRVYRMQWILKAFSFSWPNLKVQFPTNERMSARSFLFSAVLYAIEWSYREVPRSEQNRNLLSVWSWQEERLQLWSCGVWYSPDSFLFGSPLMNIKFCMKQERRSAVSSVASNAQPTWFSNILCRIARLVTIGVEEWHKGAPGNVTVCFLYVENRYANMQSSLLWRSLCMNLLFPCWCCRCHCFLHCANPDHSEARKAVSSCGGEVIVSQERRLSLPLCYHHLT